MKCAMRERDEVRARGSSHHSKLLGCVTPLLSLYFVCIWSWMNVVLPHRDERKRGSPKGLIAREKAVFSLVFIVCVCGCTRRRERGDAWNRTLYYGTQASCVCGVCVYVMRENGCEHAKKGTLRQSKIGKSSSVMICLMWFNQHRQKTRKATHNLFSPTHGRSVKSRTRVKTQNAG